MAPLWIFCCLYFALSSVSAVLVPLNVLVLSTPGELLAEAVRGDRWQTEMSWAQTWPRPGRAQ
jgi:hypothetical protein